MALLVGCSSVKTVYEQSPEATKEDSHYMVITYIHGDGDYLFHDQDGKAVRADDNALRKLHKSAKEATNGEYFIFHPQGKNKFLRLFPRRNNQLYHYRNGELINLISYRNESNSGSFLETESRILRDLKSPKSTGTYRTVFLYFGHEIPLYHGKSYHRSRPGVDVNTATFANGIRKLIPEDERFDLIALSTCNNGSPAMVHQLQNRSDVVLASPQNLHLSHLDTEQLFLLETAPEISTFQLAERLAESTFERLTKTVQTAVTLSVYDMDKLESVMDQFYVQSEEFVDQKNPNLYRDNIDCSKLPFFASGKYSPGVSTLFRPAKFGRNTGDSTHSGWGCKGL